MAKVTFNSEPRALQLAILFFSDYGKCHRAVNPRGAMDRFTEGLRRVLTVSKHEEMRREARPQKKGHSKRRK